jgi:serine protease Do
MNPMRKKHPLFVGLAFCLLLTGSKATAQATKEASRENRSAVRGDDDPRMTYVVKAVLKARDSILTLKAVRGGNWGGKETVGTGVVVDERGYAITNSHVVHNLDRVLAILRDGTELSCSVIARVPSTDLAILRLPPGRTYKEMTFGPGSDLLVGEPVIAIGNPFGYANSVSTGIISALGREIGMPSGERLKNLIQITASINPGNSGGPLLNAYGELIGINVALRDGAQGIAFALNVDDVQRVLSQHLSARKVARVDHGLSCKEDVVPEQRTDRQKVVVAAVEAQSPAAAAGLKARDVILQVGNRPVANRFDLERALWNCKDGDKVEARILRDGKVTTVALKLSNNEPAATQVSKGGDLPVYSAQATYGRNP